MLAERRKMRIRPATDVKVLTSWNGLMIIGLVDAYCATGDNGFLEKAKIAAEYYMRICLEQDGKLWRTTSNEGLRIPGFLDDYAFMMKAFLDLYQVTFDWGWLKIAGNAQ